nr:4'-phosphopantetheinyl transferase superfamily protein [Massilia sp. YIM B02763]
MDADKLADGVLAPYVDLLGDSEKQRLAHFLRPVRRRQYLAGRVLARHALAQVLDVDPRSISLEERHGAAPVLAVPPDQHAGFSISHSGRWVACAASAGSKLGLDIETVDATRDMQAIAEHAFDEAARNWLADRPDETRVRDFFHLWSSMEAQFKLGTTAASQFCLSTQQLSIVLCCEQVLSDLPTLEVKEFLP